MVKKKAKKTKGRRTLKRKSGKKKTSKKKQRRLDNPSELLHLVKDIVTGKPVKEEEARQAVEQVYRHHENQLRVFLVAAAKAKLDRIIQCTDFIEKIEKELFKKKRITDETTVKDPIKLYSFSYGMQHGDLDFVRQVTEMNVEIQKILGVVGSSTGPNERIAKILDKTPKPYQRSKIRQAVEECLAIIKDEEDRVIDVTPRRQSSEEDPEEA